MNFGGTHSELGAFFLFFLSSVIKLKRAFLAACFCSSQVPPRGRRDLCWLRGGLAVPALFLERSYGLQAALLPSGKELSQGLWNRGLFR